MLLERKTYIHIIFRSHTEQLIKLKNRQKPQAKKNPAQKTTEVHILISVAAL